jgi:hypothetical protein
VGPANGMTDVGLMEGVGKQAHDRIHFLTRFSAMKED